MIAWHVTLAGAHCPLTLNEARNVCRVTGFSFPKLCPFFIFLLSWARLFILFSELFFCCFFVKG